MKFIILCYPRTGSTLLITALGAHPDITQGMDIFNPEQEGDDPWVHWRKATLEALYGHHDSYLDQRGNLDGERFDLSLLSREFFKAFDGTKIMYDQLDGRSSVWDHLASLPDLRVIILRRNVIEAAVSFRIAMETNVWFIPNEHSYLWYISGHKVEPTSPRLVYPTWYFDWFYNHYCSSEEFFIGKFTHHATLVVDYHNMTSNWGHTIQSVQKFLGTDPLDLPMMFDKRTHGPIEELIANYGEITTYYANHPILARHFRFLASQSRARGRLAQL